MLEDLRYAIRLLLRSPGFAVSAILAVALGIGANTAIFSAVQAVLVSPLPYAEPDRLAMVWEDASFASFPRNTPAPANWADWRKMNTVFAEIAATRGRSYSLTGEGAPERLIGRSTTASFWNVMGAAPLLGRVYTEAEENANASVAVLSYGLWQRRFGGERGVLGRKFLLDGQPFTVLAVMPRGFTFPSRQVEIWTPLSLGSQVYNRHSHYLTCVGRLKPGVTVPQAQAEMSLIMKRLEREHPDSNRRIGAVVVPLREEIVGNTRAILIALLCAAACVLLIACANIANLLLARGTDRQREMAVRAAMGAAVSRLVRQLITESLLIAAAGAAAGLAIARAGMLLLDKLVPSGMAAAPLQLDWRLLAFAGALTLVTGLLFGAVPALAATRLQLHDALKQGGRGSAGRTRNAMRDLLVVTQVSLALALLTGAGLMIRTLYNLGRVDAGMRTDHLLTMVTQPPQNRYPTHASREAFIHRVLEGVRALPGVVSAGYTSNLPFTTRGNTNSYLVTGQDNQAGMGQDALFRVMTPDFLATAGARLREGRYFNDQDREGARGVAIVNETLANLHWPGQSALGRTVLVRMAQDAPWLEIVGVVREIRERGIDAPTKPAVYIPLAQAAKAWPITSDLAVRTSADPLSLAAAVRQVVWSVDRDQPVTRVRSMEDVAGEEFADRRQSMTLLGIFAALALVMAIIGIYGVLSYMVSQRSREIAVRMAIGARPGQVLGMIAGRGLWLTAVGVILGAGASMAASRLLRTLLFGIRERDPWTLGAVSLLLMLVAMAACLVPARRAARMDPTAALRNE